MESGWLKQTWKLQQGERKYTRIPIHAHARMLIDNRIVEGTVKTISLRGAFVEVTDIVDLNCSVIITISSNQMFNTLSEVKAKVVSVTENGVGLKFES